MIKTNIPNNKPSNCVSYHDDICFAENHHVEEISE